MSLDRWIKGKIEESLETRRVTMLVGARQCGKTTLTCDIASQSDFEYVTLDDEEDVAASDPNGFIKHDKKTMIIDEIQRVPKLILAIKKAVDTNNRYGQYIITGSADIQSLPSVKESLAGRAKKVRLRPFSYGEYLGLKPNFINRLKNKNFIHNNGFDKRKIIELAFKGGFPEPALNQDKINIQEWYRDYTDLILDNDLKYVANVKRQNKLRMLFNVINAYSSKYITKSDIARELSISRATLDEYLNILERVYLIDGISAWHKRDYETAQDKTKYFMCDTGLMCSILNWNEKDTYKDSDKSGKLTETFVYNQIVPQVELERDMVITHWRDNRKREIDFIIEDNDNIYGIEVKSGTDIKLDSFKHLEWFSKNLAKDKNFTGIILYTGVRTMQWENGMYSVPMNNLWD
ncbi:MAG: ATP-binding protein [Candidatus Gastranaerophilaceae bacterium]|nr:ATP-binding protein [Candidatus Gastranaerophilaceae bacterium]